MPLSDLTGTKWVLNGSPDLDTNGVFTLNFSSDGYTFDQLYIGGHYGVTYYSNGQSYEAYSYWMEEWNSSGLRIIEITGGTDATNANLISWLEANATQVEVTDLTDTTWTINNNVSYLPENTENNYFNAFELNFASPYSTYSWITSLDDAAPFNDVWLSNTSDIDYATRYINAKELTISITGGTDTTNPDLIAWLSTNATYQAPVVGNVYEITHSLTNLTHGNVSFTITPDTGYALPSSVSVTNGTLVSYDSSTGVVVVSGDSVEISVSCEAASVGYEVEIIGAGGHFERIYVQLNDDPTWYYAQMLMDGGGFGVLDTNIPNAYTILQDFSIGIANISKIKIGTDGNPANYTGPKYISGSSTGDFANLTFTSTGGSAPAYATGKITMTQDSTICFEGDD